MSGTAIWTGPNAAQVDGNQNPTLMAVAGTLGTSDTKGTSAPIRVSADPSTGALYVNNLGASGSGSGGTNVNIVSGTLNAVSKANSGTGTVSVATVTTSFATVVVANTLRHSVILTHQSQTGTIYLGFGTAVTTSTGFPLLGNQIVGWDDYTGPIYAIASSGTINTNYVEL